MRTMWLSSKRMTVMVDVDEDGIIVDTPPIARNFIGQPYPRLVAWMHKQGGLQEYEYETVEPPDPASAGSDFDEEVRDWSRPRHAYRQ